LTDDHAQAKNAGTGRYHRCDAVDWHTFSHAVCRDAPKLVQKQSRNYEREHFFTGKVYT
jgi:hypothetical protein